MKNTFIILQLMHTWGMGGGELKIKWLREIDFKSSRVSLPFRGQINLSVYIFISCSIVVTFQVEWIFLLL